MKDMKTYQYSSRIKMKIILLLNNLSTPEQDINWLESSDGKNFSWVVFLFFDGFSVFLRVFGQVDFSFV